MGYARSLPYSLLEFKTELQDEMTLTTAGGHNTIAVLTLPTFSDTPDYAYVDVVFESRTNTNALENYFVNGNVEISVGANYYNCCSLVGDFFKTPATTTVNNTSFIPGHTNIKDYVSSGANRGFYINVQTAQNNLVLKNVYAVLRMYFDVT